MWQSPEFPRTQETAARSFPAALLPKMLSIADQTPRDALLQRFQRIGQRLPRWFTKQHELLYCEFGSLRPRVRALMTW